MQRREFIQFVAAGAAGAIAQVGAGNAQPLAGKQIRLVVPFPAGGPTDIVARPFAQMLGDALKSIVVVDNRGGAGGSLGADSVAKSAPDGQTLLMATVGTHAINPALYKKLPYDPVRDFTPVAMVAMAPVAIVVNPAQPIGSLAELVALARKTPGKLNYGSAGVGGFGHMSGALFCVMTKVQMTHISYKGLAQALTDLIGGHIQVSFNSALPTVPHIHSGKVRALAATGAKRMAILPDLPTIAESGVAGYESSTWTAIGAPARTPRAIVQRLNQEINTVLQMRDIQERFAAGGSTVTGGTPEEFRDYLKSELAKFQKLVKEAGIKGEAGV